MNFYKKLFPKKMRFAILKMFRFIPDKTMLKIQYWIKFKRKLNLKQPNKFSEKIQWYKLYYRDPIMNICVDKYRVREYLSSKNLEGILVKLYGVYDSADEIVFDRLPNSFVLKTTNGSGTNIICKNKNDLNEQEVKRKIKNYFKQSNSNAGREWAYSKSSKKIIVEELLIDSDNPNGIDDYKFYCFNGIPRFVVVDKDRYADHKRNFYSSDWALIQVTSEYDNYPLPIDKPKNYERMIEIVKTLSNDFPFVRVDLYNIQGKIYFGELTFYPYSGYMPLNPSKYDVEFGEMFELPSKTKEKNGKK